MFQVKKQNPYEFIHEGNGHPLVLLHGLMGGLSNFDSQIKFFSEKGFSVYVPKLPIFDLPTQETTVDNIAKFLYSFLQDIVKNPATLIGNSLGGHLGLVVCHDHPEQVHSLVLMGSSGLYEKSFGETFPKRSNFEYIKMKTEEVFYDPKTATEQIVQEIYDTVNDREKAIKTLYIARSAMTHNMSEEIKKITQPVCLIWGKQDNVTPPDVAEEFNKYLVNSKLYWIDKCGHAPMMEHPDLFNVQLSVWLTEIGLMKNEN